MRDELKNIEGSENECMIINTDHSSNEGTHWTCLFTKNGRSFYFDPYGILPTPEVEGYCKKPRFYSSTSIQKPSEVVCGHYCIYVIYRLCNGDDFYDILDELYRYSKKI